MRHHLFFIDKCSQCVNVESDIDNSESVTPLQLKRSIYTPCFTQAEQPIVGPIHPNQEKGRAIRLTDPKTGEDLTDIVLKPKKRQHSDKRDERFLISTEDQEKLVLLFSEFIKIVSILYYVYTFIELIILLYTFLVISFDRYKK